MSKRLQLRGGTTTEHASFTGAVREVTVDTTKDTLVVHDGSTVGGTALSTAADVAAAIGAIDLTAAIATVIDAAPASLNTLNELAAALGDDANYAATTTTAIGVATDAAAAAQLQANTGVATANAALARSGGAMTGAITTNSTFDGRDVAADGVTADAALARSGGTMTGDTLHGDYVKAKFGAGNDLTIYHDGSHSRIKDSGTGHLVLSASTVHINNAASNENMLTAVQDGAVTLFHNHAAKLATTSSGVSITGDMTASGNVTAYSDERLKSSVETIPDALSKVLNVRGVTFDMNAERGTGVIAQELEKVLPEAVFDNEDGFKSVAYGNVVGLLIEAIKEQQTQIETLMDMVGE
jgi:hypothetical protein